MIKCLSMWANFYKILIFEYHNITLNSNRNWNFQISTQTAALLSLLNVKVIYSLKTANHDQTSYYTCVANANAFS